MMQNQRIALQLDKNISLFIKREDLFHPFVSGNKFRKLKYNLIQAKTENKKTIITFGGAYSNHIAAVAFAANEKGFKSVGIIRGQELETNKELNPTLKFAKENGMEFVFISRELYRNKRDIEFINDLNLKYPDCFIIPEGGTNLFAIKGCEEILTQEDIQFDFVCCAVGTGGTISGLINSSFENQKILGFPALKGDFLRKDICKFAKNNNWDLIDSYHFGGYAKINKELIEFINKFYLDTKIPLDPVYTGKMVFGILDLIKNNYFKENSKILIIHTGGLQGINGMNDKLSYKNLPKINFNV